MDFGIADSVAAFRSSINTAHFSGKHSCGPIFYRSGDILVFVFFNCPALMQWK